MRNFLYIIAFVLLLTGCVKEHFSFYSVEERLTGNIWIVKTYVNNDNDFTDDTEFFTYEFKDDGTFRLTSNDTGLTRESTWEFIDERKYIKIGNDIYSLDFISNRLISLGYGNVTIYLVPQGE
ncbi:MAG: hypothetical protein A2W91_18990 [Bacteroidetes bacterium GWF2_38_335]|nr:MAG: hypothetical protein A2W91_18990 [Bacteroidetes bacterium GWF2_38_335]OFY80240.1 MAG: hypothetical protein A2281_17205 [Bacteroidetes bacterium RIFOXYA12_FULL_38_20]HBS88730.1 hypothetical protein [Bacteroidales bacterium]